MAPHSSILDWKTSWAQEPGGLQSLGPQELDTTEWLSTHTLQREQGDCWLPFQHVNSLEGITSVLTTGLDKLKILDPSENCSHKADDGSKHWRDKDRYRVPQITIGRADQKQKLPLDSVPGQENLNWNWHMSGGWVWTSFSVKISAAAGESPSRYSIYNFISFTSRSPTRLS